LLEPEETVTLLGLVMIMAGLTKLASIWWAILCGGALLFLLGMLLVWVAIGPEPKIPGRRG